MTAAFYAALHAAGILCTLPLAGKIPSKLLFLTGFVWGMILWFFSSLLILLLGIPYSWMSMGAISMIIIAGAVTINIKQKSFSLPVKDWLIIFASTAAVGAISIILTKSSFVYATTDSFNIIYHGKVLARSGLVPWAVNSFSKLGPFSPVMQMSSQLLPGEYLSGYQTILGLILAALIFFTIFEQLRKNQHPLTALTASGLVLLSLGSVTFLNHLFYIHSNLPAAVFLFLLSYAFWHYYRTGNQEWAVLGSAALLGFSFTRIEGPLYSALIILLLISVKAQDSRRISGIVLPYTAINLFWYIYLLLNVAKTEQLSQANTLIIIAVLLGLLILALISKWIPRLIEIIPESSLLILAACLVLAIMIEPNHLVPSITAIWQNLSNVYYWNWTWFIILAGVPLLFVENKDHPENRLLSYLIGGYILIVLLLVLARVPYRDGKTDSANRLMLQLLPTILFAISVRIKAVFPGRSAA